MRYHVIVIVLMTLALVPQLCMCTCMDTHLHIPIKLHACIVIQNFSIFQTWTCSHKFLNSIAVQCVLQLSCNQPNLFYKHPSCRLHCFISTNMSCRAAAMFLNQCSSKTLCQRWLSSHQAISVHLFADWTFMASSSYPPALFYSFPRLAILSSLMLLLALKAMPNLQPFKKPLYLSLTLSIAFQACRAKQG